MKNKIEHEVETLQKKLGIDSSKFLTAEEIEKLHKKQQWNLIKDFSSNINNRI